MPDAVSIYGGEVARISASGERGRPSARCPGYGGGRGDPVWRQAGLLVACRLSADHTAAVFTRPAAGGRADGRQGCLAFKLAANLPPGAGRRGGQWDDRVPPHLRLHRAATVGSSAVAIRC